MIIPFLITTVETDVSFQEKRHDQVNSSSRKMTSSIEEINILGRSSFQLVVYSFSLSFFLSFFVSLFSLPFTFRNFSVACQFAER